MVKINKQLEIENTPISLVPPFRAFFSNGILDSSSCNTHKKRHELIRVGKYVDEDSYNRCYKKDDVRTKLKELYHNKCAYCEQKIEQWHIEHYRPKQTYYWLAFSWDNLIVSCPKCNEFKATKFEIAGSPATSPITYGNMKNINTLSVGYDKIEQPLLINPEVDDPTPYLEFDKQGKIYSKNKRVAHTIKTCKIDRAYLNDERKKILDDLRRELEQAFLNNANSNTLKSVLKQTMTIFKHKANDKNYEYLAFRRYIIQNFLTEILRDLFG